MNANLFFFATVLLRCGLGKEKNEKTCLTEVDGNATTTNLTNNETGLLSVVEAVAGSLINFYNVKFFDQYGTDFATSQTMFYSSRPAADDWSRLPYASVCELRRLAHLPLDKVVLGRCSCDGCAHELTLQLCRGEDVTLPNYTPYISPEAFAEVVVGAELAESVGGVMSYKLDLAGEENNATAFAAAMDAADGKSAFFSEQTQTTIDTPRHVIVLNSLKDMSWDNSNAETVIRAALEKAAENGVNYAVFAYYGVKENAEIPHEQAVDAWLSLSSEQQLAFRRDFPDMRFLLSVGGAVSNWETAFDPALAQSGLHRLLVDANNNYFRGVDLAVDNFSYREKDKAICWFSYAAWFLRRNWPSIIVSVTGQVVNFAPLYEKVDASVRQEIFGLFENGKWDTCYSKITDFHDPANIPEPSEDQRPVLEDGALPYNYFLLKGISTQSTEATEMDNPTTVSFTTTTLQEEEEEGCSCQCTCKPN